MTPTIQTIQGRYFDFRAPEAHDFAIAEIGHALSNICRFTGHTKVFYSVAQHSVLVSRLVPPEHALAGLLHDAHEAYMGDVSAPLKMLLPDYRALELVVERALRHHFGLSEVMPPCIKTADRVALQTERISLMPLDATEQWSDLQHVESMPGLLKPQTPREAFISFMARWFELEGHTA